jgi:hypothetical protein
MLLGARSSSSGWSRPRGFDLNTGEGELVYKGPKRIRGADAGATVVKEVVRTGDFEAVLSWAIGLDRQGALPRHDATAPSRLIVDFRKSVSPSSASRPTSPGPLGLLGVEAALVPAAYVQRVERAGRARPC